MNKKLFEIYVIHYSKLKVRAKYFDKISKKNLRFVYITEKNLKPKSGKLRLIYNKDTRKKYLISIYCGHLTNIFKSRFLALFGLSILNILLQFELKFKKNNLYLYNKFFRNIEISDKVLQINLMHAKALERSAIDNNYSIIFEDDAIFNPKNLIKNICEVQKFIENRKDAIVFISLPSAKVNWAIEDRFKFKENFIEIKPPVSKGASGYILHRDLAKKLSHYIKIKGINLPIDLILTFWAFEKGIKIYWAKNPFILEGSGNIYKSSLR